MSVKKKGGAVLSKLKSAAQAGAASLPSAKLLNAVVDQVSHFETGVRQTVDALQGKVQSLQANLLKMYQAHKELEQENQLLTRQLMQSERENSHLKVKLESTEIELSMLRAKLENITRLLNGVADAKPAKPAVVRRKSKA